MATETLDIPLSTRATNMAKRRQRILAEARRLITEVGYDALTTRALAKAAEVSQPTLYNLIGRKNDILMMLTLEAIERIEARLATLEGLAPLALAEAVVLESTDLFESDEPYYRASMIAVDRLIGTPSNALSTDVVSARSAEMAAKSCRAAIAEGLLRGNIPAETLGEQMYINYYAPFRSWSLGDIDISEFRRRALRGFYICLAADASDTFRTTVMDRIKKLEDANLKQAS